LKKKILFLIANFMPGGAERNLVMVANNLDKTKYDCYILCLNKAGSLYNLIDHATITVIDLKIKKAFFSIMPIFFAIKKIQPNIAVSWLSYLNAYLAFFIPIFGKKIYWVCRESSPPSMLIKTQMFPWFYKFLYTFYKRYDNIICQTEFMANDLIEISKVQKSRIHTIGNGVDFTLAEKNKNMPIVEMDFDDQRINLLYVGGLRAVKRVELVIKVLELLPIKYKLTIIGDGDQYEKLNSYTDKNNLANRIKFIGNCINPYPFYTKANCLLLCSSYEGFPNVVIEAFACGCPVIGFNIQGSTNEILKHYGGYGIENGDLAIFAEAIIRVCEIENLDREKIISICKDKHNFYNILKKYESFLDGINIK